ncbi:RNA methyltransferase [Candidatus Peregrinibacteria bacterium CG11_big_fil_rev_8_21_14_0_20_46_8]|nr:MAG: RNA methyltransferase [Candidatus Peregrinibacteria bacterium CG11_big_fil_rev_8_21_14_0_20_46_8]
MIIILDNIRSKHNVGSIFRTSDACGGIEKIFLCGITPLPIDKWGKTNTGLTKVSLGAESYIPWEHADDAESVIDRLKRDGYQILALELSPNATPYSHIKIQKNERAALILGGEVTGLLPEILAQADQVVAIPMHGRKESLNVAVAFGIVAYGILP